MADPAKARPPLPLVLSFLVAFIATPLCVNAQTLGITPIGADASVIDQSKVNFRSIVVTRDTSLVTAGDAFQSVNAGVDAGTVKYLTHANTTPSGTPQLEASGSLMNLAAGGVFYQLSNVGSTTVTLPAGTLQWSLASGSGSRGLPATSNLSPLDNVMQVHTESLSFGLGQEVANDGFAAYIDRLIATQTPVSFTQWASGAANNIARYSTQQGAWTQDDTQFSDNHGSSGKPNEAPIGLLAVNSFEHNVSLSMTLSNDQDITIAPGTSRLFGAFASSMVWIFPGANADPTQFGHVFKDATHSATLSLQLPPDIAVAGERPTWVSSVPEASPASMALVGLFGLLGWRRAPRWRRTSQG